MDIESSETLSGRRALVTAATRGIGRAVAERLISRGARVHITGTGEGTLRAGESIGADGASIADFTIAGQGSEAARSALAGLDGVDILVVNTGGPRPGAFAELTDEEWMRAYHLILGSAIELTRACLPGMSERGFGRIVFLTSVAGVVKPLPRLHLSNAMRAGVAGLAASLALEVGADGITVNTIATGAVDTDRHSAILKAQSHAGGRTVEELADDERAAVPVRRIGTTADLAALVSFLCSDAAGYITGAEHVIDGGASLA